MTARPSTAEYQRHRTDTLTGLAHAKVLKTARDLMEANRAKGKRYSQKIKDALRANIAARDGIAGTDGVQHRRRAA